MAAPSAAGEGIRLVGGPAVGRARVWVKKGWNVQQDLEKFGLGVKLHKQIELSCL